jgi:hypothetical protein
MSTNANIKSMLETVERIFEAAHISLESMPIGDRIQIKELAQTVALAVAMEPKHVLGFVNHFAHHTDIAYVTRGKNGGIIRGTRPVKTDKPKKAKAPAAADTTASATV